MPQGRGIFPLLTVEENLLLGVRGAARSATSSREVFARFPRIQERLRQSAGTLSGGEQQMLAIARCLLMEPKLIMLDEPTEGIMPKLVTQIRHEIADIARRGISVLLVEQNLRTALRLANRVYLMERGQVVHEGTADSLQAESRHRSPIPWRLSQILERSTTMTKRADHAAPERRSMNRRSFLNTALAGGCGLRLRWRAACRHLRKRAGRSSLATIAS